MPGTCAQLAQDSVRDLPVAIDVGAVDLDVDRRGQAEVQDLGHDVGRQEDRRSRPGNARGSSARSSRTYSRSGAVVRLQRDHDVGVGGADQARSRCMKC